VLFIYKIVSSNYSGLDTRPKKSGHCARDIILIPLPPPYIFNVRNMKFVFKKSLLGIEVDDVVDCVFQSII